MKVNPLFAKGLLVWIYISINTVITFCYSISIKESWRRMR